jgi:predicted adenine nucleotide alpha hydrolase (AANH) superfamily ATPase
MERLLLHHCCAPCSVNVVPRLAAEFDLASFWYNPNIHPDDEHGNRKASLVQLTKSAGLELFCGPNETMEQWIERYTSSGIERCRFCYISRLTETARAAKKQGIGRFSTTLLSSPYQKHDLIKEIGSQVQETENVIFVYRDFRPSYYEGKNEARSRGYYMQKYCGCIFSRQERENERARRGGTR